MTLWSRPEPFGAWVRVGDGVLVAVDHALGAKLGVATGAPARGADAPAAVRVTAPLEVSLSVTTRCRLPCGGCYLDARPDGHDVPTAVLLDRLGELAREGASVVAFGGGEPLLHPGLPELAAYARRLGLVPVATSSGAGLTRELAARLAPLAQVNISHDGVGGGYQTVRGFDGASFAENAIGLLREAGLRVGLNLVLTRDSFHALEATAARAVDLGCVELQLLRFKPAGRAEREGADGYDARRLTREQAATLWSTLERLARRFERALSLRIDCSMLPLVAPELQARGLRGAELAAKGVWGCEAGRYLASVGVGGRVAPCSFFAEPAAPSSPPDVSAPARRLPLVTECVSRDLEGMRSFHAALPRPCSSCEYAAVCRGGCQVVSRFVRGELGPDPECRLAYEDA